MKILTLFFVLIFLSSCQDTNSNSSDRSIYGPITFDETDPNFPAAYGIIQRRCVNCHTSYHSTWSTFTSNALWVADRIVNPGDPQNSIFIQKIFNSGSSGANMPIGGSPLPDSEYQQLLKWIQEMP